MKNTNMQAERMRGLAWAFPEELFPPFTDAEKSEHAGLICRANAEMGRYLKTTLVATADVIDKLCDEVAFTAKVRKELSEKFEGEKGTKEMQIERNALLQEELDRARQKLHEQVNRATIDRQSRQETLNDLEIMTTGHDGAVARVKKLERLLGSAYNAVKENANDCNELTSALLAVARKHKMNEDSTGALQTIKRLDSKIEQLHIQIDQANQKIREFIDRENAPRQLGIAEGETCGRDGCEGIIVIDRGGKECSCHISPPCSACVDATVGCPRCDWRAV